MKKRVIWSIVIYMFVSALLTAKVLGLEITQVHSDHMTFDPAQDESLSVQFAIDETAEVTLHIYDGRDREVKVVEGGHLTAGEHALLWDGRDLSGRRVPPEAYVYTLSATSDQEKVIHDLTDLTGGAVLKVGNPEWHESSGEVRYHLNRPARVSVRLGLKEGGPLLRTLIDWVPRSGGAQAEAWNGWDASGVLSFAHHPKLNLAITAYSLSDNTVFVEPRPNEVSFADLPEEPSRERQAEPRTKRMYFHSDQPLEKRGDIRTFLTIDKDLEQDKEGRWIVSGRVPIRLNVAKKDRARLLEQRFEPVFFVDGTFAFENEVGFLPTTWHWDSRTVNTGEHYITVNVRGYEGNFGTASLKVWVTR